MSDIASWLPDGHSSKRNREETQEKHSIKKLRDSRSNNLPPVSWVSAPWTAAPHVHIGTEPEDLRVHHLDQHRGTQKLSWPHWPHRSAAVFKYIRYNPNVGCDCHYVSSELFYIYVWFLVHVKGMYFNGLMMVVIFVILFVTNRICTNTT